MSSYEPTEFHADQWEEEPLTQEAEEERLKDYFYAFVQRYLGDRDLDWLHDAVFDTAFGTRQWEGSHLLLEMFVQFAKCVYYVDEREESPRFCMRQLNSFFATYEGVSSSNPVTQGIIDDMRLQLQQRRELTARYNTRQRTSSDSSDSSEDSD